jgi:queuine tRNA-ribosyltransferase
LFTLQHQDGSARTGVFSTAHGDFQTPAFMPVGTQGTVKGVTPAQLTDLGAQIILSNTYHLHLRPGDEAIKKFGGLHKFMNWDGPILTDSGGFQIFSLTKLRKIVESGVSFKSHIDGSPIELTPEKVVNIQENLGVDIMMVLDECLGWPAERDAVRTSLELTTRWAKRAKEAKQKKDCSIFGIVQGGMYLDLRLESAQQLVEIGFDGYAVGGLSVGEPPELMYEVAEKVTPHLPTNQIRYLMGVGTPVDLLEAVSRGVDLFDCVIPTRSARFGRLFTKFGPINIRNAKHRENSEPIQSDCECYTCKNFTCAYLSHLIHSQEALFVTLSSIHNLHFYQWLVKKMRTEIMNNNFLKFKSDFLSLYKGSVEE